MKKTPWRRQVKIERDYLGIWLLSILKGMVLELEGQTGPIKYVVRKVKMNEIVVQQPFSTSVIQDPIHGIYY